MFPGTVDLWRGGGGGDTLFLSVIPPVGRLGGMGSPVMNVVSGSNQVF